MDSCFIILKTCYLVDENDEDDGVLTELRHGAKCVQRFSERRIAGNRHSTSFAPTNFIRKRHMYVNATQPTVWYVARP